MAKRTVVGAGLSGMVAAIDLARQGDEVLIVEKEKAIGGSPAYHPSLHATPIDFKYTSDFIGIDVSTCFELLVETQLWVRDTRLYPSLNHYGVERGDRETAIDTYLYKICLDHGVEFEFGHPVKRLKDIPPGSIVATGTMCTVDDFTVHKRIEGYGYAFVMDTKLGPANWQFADMYSPDYFYAAAMNGILYGLVFGRRTRIAEEALEVIGRQCRERAGFEIEGWKPFYCETMIGTRLFFGPGNRYIMTGSASGSYDPYLRLRHRRGPHIRQGLCPGPTRPGRRPGPLRQDEPSSHVPLPDLRDGRAAPPGSQVQDVDLHAGLLQIHQGAVQPAGTRHPGVSPRLDGGIHAGLIAVPLEDDVHRALIIRFHGLGDSVNVRQDIGNKELGRLDLVVIELRVAVFFYQLPLARIILDPFVCVKGLQLFVSQQGLIKDEVAAGNMTEHERDTGLRIVTDM